MNFLKNIADKAKSVADSPSRSFSRGEDSPSAGAGEGQEGFICPLCLASFPSPEALQSHYESGQCLAKASPTLDKRFGSLDLVNNYNGQEAR